MDDRHPKRRKDKYNPYTLSMIDGKCYLSFRDGQGVPHRLELDVKLYAVFDRFELDDLSFLNEQERHLDWTELNEELLSRRSAQEPAPVEDAVYESMQTQALREGVNQLPEVQKRRLQMYFFDGLTYEEIAVREGCSYQAVQKSIAAALKQAETENGLQISSDNAILKSMTGLQEHFFAGPRKSGGYKKA